MFFSRLKLKIKEAKIQKLEAELIANKMASDLSDVCELQESSSRLQSLETEPVKLTGSQTGMQSDMAYKCTIAFDMNIQFLQTSVVEKPSGA